MSRRPLIAGNWKMHLGVEEAARLAAAVAAAADAVTDREVMIAPQMPLLPAVASAVAGSALRLGAQNACWAGHGAFTGEASPVLLKELGCSMVILGHSERRHIFGEMDGLVNRRLLGVVEHGLTPVLCVGETLDEREEGRTREVVERQVREGLQGLSGLHPDSLVVAYEPVWAIGTGKTATREQAQEVHAFIRTLLGAMFEKTVASQIRILYGGSVNSQTIDDLMREPDVDGALVGGAALKADEFTKIIHFK